MKKLLKFSAAILGLVILYGCSGGASILVPPPSPATQVSASISSPATLFGNSILSQAQQTLSNKLAAASGAVYYIPVFNNGSTAFGVTNATVSDTTGVWTVSADAARCKSIAVGSSCNVAVGFKGSRVSSATQLSTLVTLTYSDGSSAFFPVTGQIVRSGVFIQMPSAIVPNQNGVAYGVITLFNATSESLTVQGSLILPNQDPHATWVFKPNCDGAGSSVVVANSTCSVGFTYTTTAKASAPVQVSIPILNNVTGITTTPILAATAAAPSSPSSPEPFLSYNGGAVSILNSVPATLNLQNNGNGTLTGITLSVLPSGVSSTNTCSNVVAGGVCAVTLTGTTTSSFTLAITPTNGSGSGLGNIQVSGQVIGASASSVDFGSVFVGSISALQSISITNFSATTVDISSVIGGTNASQFDFANSGCESGSLSAFTSCTAYLTYTASAAGLQNGTFTATTTGATQVVTLTGTGESSAWTNLTTLASYSDVGASVLSLAMDPMNNLYIGNSFPQGVAGGRNVWYLTPASQLGSWTNLTNLNTDLQLSGYDGSAPTALFAESVGIFMVGHFNGLVQSCIAGSGCINAVNSNTTSGFGVTSLASLINGSVNAGLVGYSNSTNGSTGQLGFIDESGVLTLVSGVSSGVGKMAGDTSFVYVPLQNGSLAGTLLPATLTNSGATLGSNVAPSQLTSGEFITVVYDNESGTPTLYAGTSQGNVFSSPKPVTTGSWKQIATKLGGGSLFVSALGVDGSSIYAGLANLKNSSSGSGGVYVSLAGGTFTLDPSFSSKGDNSSVSSILIGNNSIYIGTMAGNVWQPK